ncbi:MAG: GTP-binding protein [Oscillospiraceae bacterium]|nr:GTP-binding protein [Oscillospiraceae bacterium]
MELKVEIKHHAEIQRLICRYPCFSFLKKSPFPIDSTHEWTTNSGYWHYRNQKTYHLQVMMIGKTGYGKSTTLNKIIGRNAFKTSDVSACTKDLYNAMYRINASKSTFFVLSDLPGVGESNYADQHYYEWYQQMLQYSDVVVYLLRADQRDFAVDEVIFSSLFQEEHREKVILALNYADKIEPINRQDGLSSEQKKSLEKKLNHVSKLFDMPKDSILYYSAADGINLDALMNAIAQKLKKRLNYFE